MITKILTAFTLLLATPAAADYTFVVPQKPGGGTSQWAEIVTTELEPFLGERIRIQYAPGARDIPGFNKWHNDLQYDDKTVMVSHGGNGVSFLQENVDYNYSEYESIGLMNLNIIVGIAAGTPITDIKFAAGSGQTPEAFAMTMIICGPDKTVEEYTECFKEHVIWVKGMSGSERRLSFLRGELNATRENPASFLKHVAPVIEEGNARVWFHHGILDAATGEHNDDPNYPGLQFEILFENHWGVAPSGEFYDAYKLVKSFRDGLQKALWINADSEYADTLREALTAMSQDADAMAAIRAKVGQYDWIIGEAGNAHRDTLMSFITEEALQTLVEFNTNALGLASVYKPELTQ